MLGHADYDDTRGTQQGTLASQRCLIVQHMFPPVSGDKLGQHDGQHLVGHLPLQGVDVGQQRAGERAIGRFDDAAAIAPEEFAGFQW